MQFLLLYNCLIKASCGWQVGIVLGNHLKGIFMLFRMLSSNVLLYSNYIGGTAMYVRNLRTLCIQGVPDRSLDSPSEFYTLNSGTSFIYLSVYTSIL